MNATAPAGSGVDRSLQEAIRQASDGELYQQARAFVNEHCGDGCSVKRAQLGGLLQYSQSWAELTKYVKHQQQRDWQGRNEFYRVFYEALFRWALALEARVKADSRLVPDGLTKQEKRTRLELVCGLQGQEFVQHLAAELMFREKVS